MSAVKNYNDRNPKVHRASVSKYTEKHPQLNSEAVRKYYEKGSLILWKIKCLSGFNMTVILTTTITRFYLLVIVYSVNGVMLRSGKMEVLCYVVATEKYTFLLLKNYQNHSTAFSYVNIKSTSTL